MEDKNEEYRAPEDVLNGIESSGATRQENKEGESMPADLLPLLRA